MKEMVGVLEKLIKPEKEKIPSGRSWLYCSLVFDPTMKLIRDTYLLPGGTLGNNTLSK